MLKSLINPRRFLLISSATPVRVNLNGGRAVVVLLVVAVVVTLTPIMLLGVPL